MKRTKHANDDMTAHVTYLAVTVETDFQKFSPSTWKLSWFFIGGVESIVTGSDMAWDDKPTKSVAICNGNIKVKLDYVSHLHPVL